MSKHRPEFNPMSPIAVRATSRTNVAKDAVDALVDSHEALIRALEHLSERAQRLVDAGTGDDDAANTFQDALPAAIKAIAKARGQ